MNLSRREGEEEGEVMIMKRKEKGIFQPWLAVDSCNAYFVEDEGRVYLFNFRSVWFTGK